MFFYRYQTLIFAFYVGSMLLMFFWMVYGAAAQNRAKVAMKEALLHQARVEERAKRAEERALRSEERAERGEERAERIEVRALESMEIQKRLLALHEAQLEQQRETNRLLAQLVAERQQLV
jgi:hypothetical protein